MLDHLVPPPEGLDFPGGAEAALIEAADGIRLRAAFIPTPVVPCRGTVFVLQGRAEFIEKFAEVFARLTERGFAVATLDWRGQGGSARQLGNAMKGHVEDFEDYLLDLDALIAEARRRAMPEPYGLLAHSTGGAIALMALARADAPFRRAVLSSPLTGIAGAGGSSAARLLARLLSSIGLSSFFVPGGGAQPGFGKPFEGNPFTGDAARYARVGQWLAAAPELGIGDPTIGWVDAAFEAMAGFAEPDFGQTNRTPILMTIAGDDRVVDGSRAAALAHRMRGASAIILRGARHEILMERDAIQMEFWAAFDAFMHLAEEKEALAS